MADQPIAPVSADQRIDLLDVIRGIAVCGIRAPGAAEVQPVEMGDLAVAAVAHRRQDRENDRDPGGSGKLRPLSEGGRIGSAERGGAARKTSCLVLEHIGGKRPRAGGDRVRQELDREGFRTEVRLGFGRDHHHLTRKIRRKPEP